MTFGELINFLTQTTQGRLALIPVVFTLAFLLHRLAPRVARRLANLNRFTQRGRRMKTERRQTLRGLFTSAITFFGFSIATLVSIGMFVDASTLVWMVGLFSAAFGLGARPLIADFLTGIGFIFEDTFDVGEKVEILGMEGVVEEVNLRTTLLRAPGGELFVVPNGEVRVVRNFSRGRFTLVKVQINVDTAKLATIVPALEILGQEAMADLPNLLEPWQVIGTGDHLDDMTELTVLAKARFGKGAEMRPRLLALLKDRLNEFDVAPQEDA
jgi:small conductance mechanosensitive channel